MDCNQPSVNNAMIRRYEIIDTTFETLVGKLQLFLFLILILIVIRVMLFRACDSFFVVNFCRL